VNKVEELAGYKHDALNDSQLRVMS
jgi:hypothetical protein